MDVMWIGSRRGIDGRRLMGSLGSVYKLICLLEEAIQLYYR